MKFYVGLCNDDSKRTFNKVIEHLALLSGHGYFIDDKSAAYLVEQWELIQGTIKCLELGKAHRFLNKDKVNTYYTAAEKMKIIYALFGYDGFTVRPIEKFAYARKH